jgi:Domain of unknown function (DUF397)
MDVTGLSWRKSSYSASNGGACVEVGLSWRKSSYSASNGGACVEVADAQAARVAVRDSKDPQGPVLAFTPDEWQAFTAGVKAGEFDPD